MQVNIREACSDDYLSIFSLIKNELGYEYTDYDKLCIRLELMRADDSYLTVVAECDGDIVGFLGLHRVIAYNIVNESMHITALAVFNNLQGKGVGSQLLRWAEEYAINNGIRNVVLTSRLHRAGAHAFYEANGFERKSYGFKKEL